MPHDQDAVLPPVRLPRALLVAAKAEAARRDETLSQVVRRALRAYVAETSPKSEPKTGAALILQELDRQKASDAEYRTAFSTGAKEKLRPGETWRDRLVARVEREQGRA